MEHVGGLGNTPASESEDPSTFQLEANDITELHVRFDSFKCRFILDNFDTADNFKKIPFVEGAVRALDIQAVHRGSSSSEQFLSEIQLSAFVESNHFNLIIAQWEPILETSHVEFKLQQSKKHAAIPLHVHCDVLCRRDVRVCLTDNFATQLTAVYSNWVQPDLVNERRAKRYAHFFSPYLLENKTGVPLVFWIKSPSGAGAGGPNEKPRNPVVSVNRRETIGVECHAFKSENSDRSFLQENVAGFESDGGCHQILLPPNERISFYVQKQREQHEGSLNEPHFVEILFEGYQVVHSVPLDTIGKSSRNLKPLDDVDAQTPKTILWQVWLEDGAHILSLRAPLCVVNRCRHVDMEVLAYGDCVPSTGARSVSAKESAQVFAILPPEGAFHVPLWLEDYTIRSRPHLQREGAFTKKHIGRMDKDWSSPIVQHIFPHKVTVLNHESAKKNRREPRVVIEDVVEFFEKQRAPMFFHVKKCPPLESMSVSNSNMEDGDLENIPVPDKKSLNSREVLVANLEVHPAITILNRLPCCMQYRLRTQMSPGQPEMEVANDLVSCGEDADLYQAYVPAKPKFSVQLPGMQWSPEIRIQSKSGDHRDSSAKKTIHTSTVYDSTGKALDICIEVMPATAGGAQIVVFSKYWILDWTGLGLSFGHKMGKYPVMGPTQTSASGVYEEACERQEWSVLMQRWVPRESNNPVVRLPNSTKLPSSWMWASDWQLDVDEHGNDPDNLASDHEGYIRDGWDYAAEPQTLSPFENKYRTRRTASAMDTYRQRRWMRKRKLKTDSRRNGSGGGGEEAPSNGLTLDSHVPLCIMTPSKDELLVRVAHSQWSRPLNVGRNGSSGTFELRTAMWSGPRQPSKSVAVGMQLGFAPGIFARSRLVVFTPHHVMCYVPSAKKTGKSEDGFVVKTIVQVMQHRNDGEESRDLLTLTPLRRRAFHWASHSSPRLIRVRLARLKTNLATEAAFIEPRTHWSPTLSINDLGEVPVCLRSLAHVAEELHEPTIRILRFSMKMDHDFFDNIAEKSFGRMMDALNEPQSILITITDDTFATDPIYRIRNASKFQLFYYQSSGKTAQGRAKLQHSLRPASSIPYGWDNPLATKKVRLGLLSHQASATSQVSNARDWIVNLEKVGGKPLTLYVMHSKNINGDVLATPLRVCRTGFQSDVEDLVESVKNSFSIKSSSSNSSLSELLRRGASQKVEWQTVHMMVRTVGRTKELVIWDGENLGSSLNSDISIAPTPPPLAVCKNSTSSRLCDRTERDPQGMESTHVANTSYNVQVHMQEVGLSVVTSSPKHWEMRHETCYFMLQEVNMHLQRTSQFDMLEVKVVNLQLDNCLRGTPFPVALSKHTDNSKARKPATAQREDGELLPPPPTDYIFHFSIIKNIVVSSSQSLHYIDYLGLKFGEIDLYLEQKLLSQISTLVSAVLGNTTDVVAKDQRSYPSYMCQACDNSHTMYGSSCYEEELHEDVVDTPILDMMPMYFEVFEVHPMKINITFARVPENRAEEYSGVNPIRILLDAMQRIDSAEIGLSALTLHHPLTSADLLFDIIKQHYVRQLKRQIMNVVGAISTLGNPAGLVRNIGTGAHDLVFESYQGLVQSPEDFVFGVGRGANSFVKHSVVGVFSSASLITQNLGMNIAALSMDKDFSQRATQFETPHGVLSGLGGGAKAFGRGVAGGVQTLFTAPIEGAKDGFATGEVMQGFGQGLAKGVAGIVVKPLVGASEMASNVLGGIASSAEFTSALLEAGGTDGSIFANGLSQARPPRAVYGRERAIRAYSREDANAQKLMWLRSRQKNDFFLQHLDLGNKVVVLTSRRLTVYGIDGKCVVEIQWPFLQSAMVQNAASTSSATRPSCSVILSEIRPSSVPSRMVSNMFGMGGGDSVDRRVLDVQNPDTAQLLVKSLEEILSQR
jgi:hypothetical protein